MPGPDPKNDSTREPSAADGSPANCVRIALIGDVHSAWDYGDVAYFNSSPYELLLIAGDLGGSQARDGLRVAGSMARLERRALVMPGNNDVDEYARIAAELTYRQGQADLLEELLPAAASPRPNGEPALRPRTCGYSLHEIGAAGFGVTIVAGRPFAKGGDQLASPEALERSFGVRSLAESRERLRQLVDDAPTEHLVFFAHNGPSGLGVQRDDLWGRDFHPDQGDWGDSDLRDAIAYAHSRERRTLAVVAGHMHWALRGGGQRRWQLRRDGTLYVNAACVPRVFEADGDKRRHHIALELSPEGARAHVVHVSDEPQ
jgi:uncharacterized protein (TIGR04168 family)